MSCPLTIIIPFYKLRFLDAALGSLAAQAAGGFKVFIGDDASPEDARPVIEKYRGRLDLEYHRFEKNLGQTSLARHWDRCVQKTDSEWVWLFSDDDLAAPDCIEAFNRALAQTAGGFDVYRFNTRMIDADGKIIHQHPAHPPVENVSQFALAKILSERFSFAVEYIFRREAFDSVGHFVHFPLAWFSDDASWITFARNEQICTIEGGEVFWRKSGTNISSPKPELTSGKFDALRLYLGWLIRRFPSPEFHKRLADGLRRTFPDQIQHWGGNPNLWTSLRFWIFFVRFTGHANFLLLRTFLGLSGLKQKFFKPAVAVPVKPAAKPISKDGYLDHHLHP